MQNCKYGETIDEVLTCLHDDVVLIAQHGEKLDVSRRREGVRKYFEDRLVGPNKVLEVYRVKPTVDDFALRFGRGRRRQTKN